MRWTTRALVLGLLVSPAWAAFTSSPTGACTLSEVPDPVKAVLSPTGIQIKDGDELFAEAWFAKEIKTAAPDSDYKDIPESIFVGVIRYAKAGQDFRDQPVKPGVYTMRYQLQPEDGAHLGTSPRRDFILLLPPGIDTDPNSRPDFKKVTQDSMKASGTPHPQILFLMQPPSGAPYPGVVTGGAHYQILTVKVGSLELGVVLVGKGGE